MKGNLSDLRKTAIIDLLKRVTELEKIPYIKIKESEINDLSKYQEIETDEGGDAIEKYRTIIFRVDGYKPAPPGGLGGRNIYAEYILIHTYRESVSRGAQYRYRYTTFRQYRFKDGEISVRTGEKQSGGEYDGSPVVWTEWVDITKSVDDKIIQEISDRIATDAQLQAAIDTEATARTNADAALQTALDTHKNDKTNPHGVTKAQVGLGNVENTTDLDKPVSTATQAAIDAEKSARENADVDLETALEAETTARTAADTTLQTSIETEATARETADEELQNALTAETTERKKNVKTLAKSLNAEIEERERIDKEMWETIDRKFSEAFPGGGTGTEDDPYVILSRDDLERVRDNLSAHYIVQGAIYLNTPWEPIGSGTTPFTGAFDGNGYTIRNLTIDADVGDNVYYGGLFAYNQGAIKNVRLENVNIKVAATTNVIYVGAVAGYQNSNAIISGCAVVSGNIYSNKGSAGGVVGNNYAQIENSYNKANVTSVSAGGIVSFNQGTIVNVYNIGEVIALRKEGTGGAYDEYQNGGIVYTNYNNATLSNAYSLFPVRVAGVVSGLSSITNVGTKTVAELKQQETFAGWDFESAWEIKPGQFPTLRIAKGVDPNVNNIGLPDGSKEHPYKIATVEEFKNISKDLDGNYVLTNGIGLADVEWTPIGTRTEPFTGSLHGNGYSIFLLSLSSGIEDDDGNTYAGLFAFNNGTLFDVDLVVDVIDVTGTNTYVGAAAAVNMENGTLEQVAARTRTTSIPIKSGNWVGGLTAINYGKIKNCYVDARLEGVNAGGIAGINEGNISYTYDSERLTTTGTAGGIVGENSGTVSNSYGYSSSSNTSATEIVGTGTAATESAMLSLTRLKKRVTYVGWDFENVWKTVIDGATTPTLIRVSYVTTEEQLAALTEEVSALNSEISGLNSTVDLLTAAVLEG